MVGRSGGAARIGGLVRTGRGSWRGGGEEAGWESGGEGKGLGWWSETENCWELTAGVDMGVVGWAEGIMRLSSSSGL